MRHYSRGYYLWAIVLILFSVNCLFAQTEKRTLMPDDYAQWQNLSRTVISPDGEWIAYTVTLVEGDDTLFVKNPNTDKLYKHALASNQAFSKNSEWLAFRIGYSEKKLDQMREKKETVKYKMGLLNLKTGDKEIIKDVSRFSFPENGDFLVMQKYKPKGSKAKGNDIVLRNLKTGTSKNIGNVTSWNFNKKGDRLAYIIDVEDKTGNAVEMLDLNNYTLHILDSDTVSFSGLVWEKEGEALAFYKSFGNNDYEEDNHKVVVYRNIYKSLKKECYDPAGDNSFPEGMRILKESRLQWAEDLSAVFFGIKEWTKKEKKEKEKKEGEEKEEKTPEKEEKKEEKEKPKKPKGKKDEKLPGVDIWHWKDDPIQPQQKVRYNTLKNFSYLSVWNIDDNKFIRIADEQKKYATLTGDQKHAYIENRTEYEPRLTLPFADYYIFDTKTGEKKKILENFYGMYGSSPDGKYLLYFKDNNWYTYDIYKDKHINLTKDADTDFWNTRYDGPRDIKPPWGMGGWLKGDKKVFLYDEYNVWSFTPDGKGYKTITDGSSKKIQFRVTRLDYDEDYLDPKEPLYLRAFGDKTKAGGYYRINTNGKIENLVYEDKSIGGLQKAEESEKYTYITQTYVESPNLYYVGKDFKNPKQISNTNPQQKDYLWGRAELVDFVNADGKKMQGVLHYPANYEEGKKYPMLVYIYEIRSNNLHRYITPSKRSFYNITNYTQQGYFVFQPDIVYKVNNPGKSAVNCVVPAVEKVIGSGKIDKSRIGLMGHSWGAYQTAFIITQTDIFSAAVAGAPLIDLVSMYNEIYWNSGNTNQNIFEISQGRFNKPFWDLLDNYLDNSPLYNATNIKTPLLVGFGDKDGAVYWHQGVEMFVTMRRLQKPYIMLVYADENHAVRKKENMIDYTKKINEFFDHYLKDKEAPEWIKEGLTYVDKKKKEDKQKKNKK